MHKVLLKKSIDEYLKELLGWIFEASPGNISEFQEGKLPKTFSATSEEICPFFLKEPLEEFVIGFSKNVWKKKHGRILFRIFKEKSLKCCLRVSGDIFEGIPDGVFKGIRGRILREFMNAFCKNPWINIRKNLREVSEGILEWVAEEIYGGISGKNHWETLCKFTIRID